MFGFDLVSDTKSEHTAFSEMSSVFERRGRVQIGSLNGFAPLVAHATRRFERIEVNGGRAAMEQMAIVRAMWMVPLLERLAVAVLLGTETAETMNMSVGPGEWKWTVRALVVCRVRLSEARASADSLVLLESLKPICVG